MSRISKQPITVPAGVEVKIGTDVVEVKGPKGTLHTPVCSLLNYDLTDGVLTLTRVAKVVKGGRRFSFSALVVVGDGKGGVGYGLGKAQEVPEALRKATERARKNRVQIPLVEGTLPYEVLGRFGAGRVMLKPASEGTGIIAGGAVRAVMEAVGVRDVLAKAIGTNNPHNVLRATMQGLISLRSADEVSELRGKKLEAPRK